ncbi:MAG: hypothetical protein IPJ52_00955 [Rhodocyclaceae bacterium]|nr:hypothetical protein [Rhodocyclaceae bacterium]
MSRWNTASSASCISWKSNRNVGSPVIAEARGQQEDDALRASFHRLMTQGTYYNKAERFQKLVCPISFRQAGQYRGIQVADLCAHPTARLAARRL